MAKTDSCGFKILVIKAGSKSKTVVCIDHQYNYYTLIADCFRQLTYCLT